MFNFETLIAEQGKFLALDLGGTNFRVLCIDLDGEQFNMMNEIYEIPQSIMLGSGEQVSKFYFLLFCYKSFLVLACFSLVIN